MARKAPKLGSAEWVRQWQQAARRAKQLQQGPLTGQAASQTPIPDGYVLFRATDDERLSILCELGPKLPLARDYTAEWDIVERHGRTSLTRFSGFQPAQYAIDVVLDSYAEGKSVTHAAQVLGALAGAGTLATGGRPPLVDVIYGTNQRRGYVVTGIDWDEEATIHDNEADATVRLEGTVSVMQHVGANGLTSRSLAAAKAERRRKGRKARKTYTVRSGENLITIARTKLGDAGRWPELAKLNDLRDPRAVKAGAVIRLP